MLVKMKSVDTDMETRMRMMLLVDYFEYYDDEKT